MPDDRQYWFPAKRYGWGWSFPTTWQGWVVIAIYVILIGVGAAFIRPALQPARFAMYMLLLTCALVAVCWLTGEPPRWRWGRRR